MMELDKYLSRLETAKGNRTAAMSNLDAAKRNYAEAFTPLESFPTRERLEEVYALCESDGNFSRSDLFICVCLLLFNPEGLFGGKIKYKLATEIGHVLGVTYAITYMARGKINLWLGLYPSFYKAVERVYERFEHDK